MLSLIGDVAGKHVLDLGCGEGRFCRMLAARGASPIGLDVVRAMTLAAYSQGGKSERYVQASGHVLPFANSTFDEVISYLTLIDITDFRAAINESARVLRPGGMLLVANLSSFITASDGWQRDDEGHRLYRRVDRYLEEREQIYESGNGIRIRNWHRPLSAYMEAYLDAGLVLRRFLEPVPFDDSLKHDPLFEGDFRVPDFSVMLWQKPF
jgi:ubiquinone/menaquinone biosynthesis C-methylase UbiE